MIGATWCHRCWHGPYLTSSPIWNSRPCGDGATATRATYYADGRFAKNDTLPCLFSGPVLDTLMLRLVVVPSIAVSVAVIAFDPVERRTLLA